MLTLENTFEKYRDDIYLSLYKILNSTTGSLLNPCYNPPVSSMITANIKSSLWKEITSNNDFDFSEYISNNIFKKTPPYLLFRDETVWFLLLVALHFYLKKKQDNIDKDLSFLAGYLILMKYYTSLSNKHMSKFCDKTKAIMALETLSDKSLFSAKNERVIQNAKSVLNMYSLNSKIKNDIKVSPIALGIVHLLNVVQENYFSKIKNLNDPKDISKLIQNVEFRCCSFEHALTNLTEKDFVYLDPPYAPINANSFVSYVSEGFSLDNHEKLFKICKEMKNKFVMSNAEVELVKASFPGPQYTTKIISCRRSINAKDPSSRVNEVLITKVS